MQPCPPIVLLITAHNRQALLDRALASLAPEIHLLHIVLVDDASTPPLSIAAFSDYPIHLIRLTENRGPMGASNAGLEYIYRNDYEFIARLDADDQAINQRFGKQLAYLRAHPGTGFIGSHFRVVDAAGNFLYDSTRPLDDAKIREAMHLGCMIHHPTWMMRTSVARKVGFYNAGYKASGDYDFAWRMLRVTHVANIADQLITYEQGTPSSITRDRRLLQAVNALKIKLRNFNPRTAYAYIGLLVSLLDITNLLQYTTRIRKKIMRALGLL